jgi:hypothetical protein
MVLVAKYTGSGVLLASCPYNKKAGEARLLVMPEHNRILEEIAEDMGVFFFDLHGVFEKSEENLPDGLHVSQKGSDLKARLYFDFLLQSYKIL